MIKKLPYNVLISKRKLENILMFPFILMGRLASKLQPLKKEYKVYYFFPFFHIGGAEKVHAQIAQATGGKNALIVFTKKSHNNQLLHEFLASGCDIKDISKYTDNKWLYFLNIIFRGIYSGYINAQATKPAVFNGQCNFGYKIAPWIRKEILQIELIHSISNFSYIRIPFLPYYTTTVMISQKRIEDHVLLYKKLQIPVSFASRIKYISNAINLPPINDKVKPDAPFKVLYSGRGGVEKRVELIISMAVALRAIDSTIQFEIMGDVSDIIDTTQYPFIKFYGNKSDKVEIEAIYATAHILLLTSTTEGFPMVIIEAMAAGCGILSTAVGDIPYHIKQEENGFLFSDTASENKIIQEGIDYIQLLKNNKQLLRTIQFNNQQYASAQFGIQQFNKAYQNVIGTINTAYKTK